MKEEDIVVRAVKAFTKTTLSNHDLPIAENVLWQDLRVFGMNQRWVSDITSIRPTVGWLYLAVIMDLYSRAMVGWVMDKHMTVALVCDALSLALGRRRTGNGFILHSDWGGQYAAGNYQTLLSEQGIPCSMSGVGNCYDNAAMESFFHYESREQAKAGVFEYIEVFYNRRRRHSYVNQMAPLQFEALQMAA